MTGGAPMADVPGEMPKLTLIKTRMIEIGIKFLGRQMLTLLALFMVAGAWGWCLYQPNWLRIASALGFSAFVVASGLMKGKGAA
jgi:hypothetical protein